MVKLEGVQGAKMDGDVLARYVPTGCACHVEEVEGYFWEGLADKNSEWAQAAGRHVWRVCVRM